MTLTEQLLELAEGSAKRHPGEAQKIMQKAIDGLVNASILDNAYKTGDKIPKIELPSATNTIVDISKILKDNRVVLVFYRGGWCPYCNLQLKALEDVLPKIEAKGAKLVAISPETPDNSLTTKEKNTLSFEVLSDVNNEVSKSLNLTFTLTEALQTLYKKFGIDLDTNQGNTNQELPVAATYIIEKDGTISYHFLQEDYKLRADPADILKALS